ncbi:60S ribosomal protein L18a-like protein [Andrographis paniculata]|uniref:60S ribosomal protein L18a-like protein n=1 Tax=Andrographis paniculata TaxID=175694 RepID=UPI0021E89DAA|nr:60S ribosomal protein L18a-like protein [Andrographis paniculata]
MSEEKKDFAGHQHEQSPPQYGTFQGVMNYPNPTVVGLPHPVPPPGMPGGTPLPPSEHYARGYQAVPGYVVAEGRPVRGHRLPCCGIGIGWFLFIIGFFLAGVPWYVGVLLLLCSRMDSREKPGYTACAIAAVLEAIALIFGLTRID